MVTYTYNCEQVKYYFGIYFFYDARVLCLANYSDLFKKILKRQDVVITRNNLVSIS